MTIVKTHAKLYRSIRTLHRMIKNAKNEARAYRAEATYHQAVIDDIKTRFHLTEFKDVPKQEVDNG
jgi:hypothetical protein